MTTRHKIVHGPGDIAELPAREVRVRALTACLLVAVIGATAVPGTEEQAQALDPLAGIVPFTENGAEAGAK